MPHNKRTKIVCTIGPASNDPAMLEQMVGAGMNVARLNFSHGTHEQHAKMIATLRGLSEKIGRPIGLLQDLQGPKIRVGSLPAEGITLVKDEQVIFTTDASAAMPKIPVTYDKLHQDVKVGDVILLDDGLLEVRVEAVEGRDIVTRVVNGGPLTSHKGFNLPTASLSVPSVTEKDHADLAFGVSQRVDWVALSFVRTAQEILDVRAEIAKLEAAQGTPADAQPIRICAKIEKHEAIKNIDAIIEAVDAIMVARGDLGIETPAEEVPMVQKRIIEKCLAAAKPVIVATQMLDSMIRNPRPTRAEVSDVANAVIDHTDAVMLSGESASGKFPLEAVQTMAKIVVETESSRYDDLAPASHGNEKQSVAVAISQLANILSREVNATLILVTTSTGTTARYVSRHRPDLPIVALTTEDRVRNQLTLSWGVIPLTVPHYENVDQLLEHASEELKKAGLAKSGDKVIIVAGEKTGVAGGVNSVEVREIR